VAGVVILQDRPGKLQADRAGMILKALDVYPGGRSGELRAQAEGLPVQLEANQAVNGRVPGLDQEVVSLLDERGIDRQVAKAIELAGQRFHSLLGMAQRPGQPVSQVRGKGQHTAFLGVNTQPSPASLPPGRERQRKRQPAATSCTRRCCRHRHKRWRKALLSTGTASERR